MGDGLMTMSNTLSLAFVAISALSLVNSIGDSYAQELSDTLVSSVGDSHLRELSDEALEAELKRRGLVVARDIEGSTSILLQEAGSGNASRVTADSPCSLHICGLTEFHRTCLIRNFFLNPPS